VTAGALIVFEGAEGAGKSSQFRRLRGRLERAGGEALAGREPGGTALGDAVRAVLLTPGGEVAPRAEALLFMAARAQLLARVRGILLDPAGEVAPRAEALLFMAARAQLMAHVRARVAEGVTVVLDRFFLSTYAYQIAGRGLPPGEVRAANQLATRGLVPDLTVLLVADPAVARARMLARGDLDRIEQEDADFHGRVAAAFLAAAEPAWQHDHPEVGPVARVDAGGTPEVVASRVWALLAARWPETFHGGAESKQGR
jgi:dTMP kinase